VENPSVDRRRPAVFYVILSSWLPSPYEPAVRNMTVKNKTYMSLHELIKYSVVVAYNVIGRPNRRVVTDKVSHASFHRNLKVYLRRYLLAAIATHPCFFY